MIIFRRWYNHFHFISRFDFEHSVQVESKPFGLKWTDQFKRTSYRCLALFNDEFKSFPFGIIAWSWFGLFFFSLRLSSMKTFHNVFFCPPNYTCLFHKWKTFYEIIEKVMRIVHIFIGLFFVCAVFANVFHDCINQ